MRTSASGVFGGLEYIDDLDRRFGLAFGYGRSSFVGGAGGTRAASENFLVAAHGALPIGNLTLAGGAAAGWHDATMERMISLPGLHVEDRTNYAARTWQLFGEASYAFTSDRFALSPFASVMHMAHVSPRFRTGGGAAALTFERAYNAQTFAGFGLRMNVTIFRSDTYAVTAQADLGWRRALSERAPAQITALEGASSFRVRGAGIDRDALAVSVGLGASMDGRVHLDVAYRGHYGARSQEHGVSGRLSLRF